MAETLTPSDVRRIATLARLELTPDEVDTFAEQLSAILAYAGQVQQVDTSGVAESPTGELPKSDSAIPQSRSDELAPCLSRDVVLEQAPDADRSAGIFKVPRVLGS
ncbi:MAG TPA: Asp-tRNA(Asn)/Glu-tRNA(Gln) amidotransferase subunit GatC [Vicinamibacterales bacterium]|nr:Asp-tRNA(Asn)/Glu-tRNA(Gln) amidotransferase subunit GatC [Vicinamibacterales bacterium]